MRVGLRVLWRSRLSARLVLFDFCELGVAAVGAVLDARGDHQEGESEADHDNKTENDANLGDTVHVLPLGDRASCTVC